MSDMKTFQELALDGLVATAERLKREGWRCVQLLAVSTENGTDLTYSFAKDDTLANYQIRGVGKRDKVPSIQNLFIGIFPFENEVADLYGVEFEGMTLDFLGRFYDTTVGEPMTILTPEAAARKEKEAKKAAAAAKKEKSDLEGSDAAAGLEAKLAGMDPEKAAKVRAAMEAKAKKEASQGGGE